MYVCILVGKYSLVYVCLLVGKFSLVYVCLLVASTANGYGEEPHTQLRSGRVTSGYSLSDCSEAMQCMVKSHLIKVSDVEVQEEIGRGGYLTFTILLSLILGAFPLK